ncbi:MAG: TRAP transporter small permease [Gammaproteobacteria bacterium]|nr:TRAP transporter small permease [Gammaproteobacteria bacterium]
MSAGDPVAMLLGALGRFERAVTFIAFMILCAVLFADVLSRELTGAGLTWARDVGVLANLVVTMVGFGIASAHAAHLRPRFGDRWLPAAWTPVLDTLREALMAAFCLAFATVGTAAVLETAALAESLPVLRWPAWPFQLVIPVVFALAALRHAALAIRADLRGGSGDAAAAGTE